MGRVVLICIVTGILVFSCTKPDLKVERETVAFPYTPIASGEEDPADYGPDDETVLDAIDGKYPPVPFSHFTHSSNAAGGYGIGCLVCHHDVDDADDATSCTECHEQGDGLDMALLGPDNNMRLEMKSKTITPTPFSHYSHATFGADGYKIGCNHCHHVEGNYAPCSECHEDLARRGEDNKVIPKLKRAFHMKCRDCHLVSHNKRAPITCEGCHRRLQYKKTEEMLPLSRSYHVMCINCHQQANDNAGKKAPTECTGCHVPPEK